MVESRSRFICTVCGEEGIPLIRPQAHLREKNHIKHLYCIRCKRRTPHREIRECDVEFYIRHRS